MSEELRPCPFCGETVSLDYSELPNKKHWYITCDCCGMMYQAVVCQRKDTKTGWNTRPIEDALRKRIAELEKALNIDTDLTIAGLRKELRDATARIAELEAENIRLGIEYRRMRLALGDIAINSKRALKESPTDQLTAHSDIERQDDKLSNDTQTDTFVYGKESEE